MSHVVRRWVDTNWKIWVFGGSWVKVFRKGSSTFFAVLSLSCSLFSSDFVVNSEYSSFIFGAHVIFI